MPPDHNQQHSRRPHYHRGRRGPDRRGDRRPPQSQQQQQEPVNRDQVDVEQIMREIRSRISERHGIELTPQQIQELAARRLEAILDPRTVKPSLMDELRRAAGLPADTAPSEPVSDDTIPESSLYQSDSGFIRVVRKLLNPLLKLFFDPAAIVDAINTQTRRAKAAAQREAESRRRQTEWNALHFEILRRLATDIARVEIDNQHLASRVESLSAKVDFNERRVRGMEHTQHQTRPGGVSRSPEAVIAAPSSSTPSPRDETPSAEHAPSDALPEGSRRRRRRRRGRRSGQPRETVGGPAPAVGSTPVVESAEGDDFDDDVTADDVIEEVGGASVTADQPPESFSQTAAEPLSPAPEAVPPAPEPVALAPESVSPAPKPVSQTPESASQAPEPVSPAPEPVSQTPEPGSLAPGSDSPPPEPVSLAPEPVSQAAVERAAPQQGSVEPTSLLPAPTEPPPSPHEPPQAGSPPVEEVPPAPESSPASAAEPVERPEPVPPERS